MRGAVIIHTLIVGLVLVVVALIWALGRVEFFAPWWLLALFLSPGVTMLALHSLSGLPPRTNVVSMTLRALVLILVVLCLADPQAVKLNKNLCTLFLLDYSASIPDYVKEQELEYVNQAAETKSGKDTVGIVVFGEDASVEVMPDKELQVDKLHSFISSEFTDLQGAVELAAAVFPADARKKIVLLTDGNENKGDVIEGINFARAQGIVTDILPVQYSYPREVAIDKVFIPEHIKEGETFDMRVHLRALKATPARLSIYRNERKIAEEDLDLTKGHNTYAVTLKIEEPGFYTFSARVSTPNDTIADNNAASSYVYIQGASRLLFLAPTQLEVDYLMQACQEHLEADLMLPSELPVNLGMLQNYDCIILANTSADYFSHDQMAMLQSNVRDLGVGLIMVGGEDGFGAGGYLDTPIEEALPVTMDIRQKKINPKGALVMVLHTCEFANGNYWAKQISKKAIETVNRQDDVGALIYSGTESWLFDLTPATDKQALYTKIDKAMPGDMPSFAPTLQLAYNSLKKSDAMVKHIIIISDGDPAAPSLQLIKLIKNERITISTVGINPHSPRDVDVLKFIAKRTGGRYYFAQNPKMLPRIFIKEAKVVKRSLIFNSPFKPQLVLSTEITKGINPAELPTLMAYVATTPKQRALTPIISDNENRDPVLSYWRYGLGKSVAFTSDATSNWGRHWVTWDKYKKVWTQIIRWASRKRDESNLRVRTEMRGGRGRLIIDAIDDDGNFMNFLTLNGRLVDPEMKGRLLEITQTAPGRYEAEFEARKVGVNILNIGYHNPRTGGQGFVAAGVSVPYSPEYKQLSSDIALLREAARIGGGRLLQGKPEEDRVFDVDLPPTRSLQPAWEALMLLALLLFFADLVVRRVIVTRDDIRSVLGLATGLFKRSKRRKIEDMTMTALLKRKKKTFEHVAKKPDERTGGDFKAALQREASQDKAADLDLDKVVTNAEPTASEDAAGAANGVAPARKQKTEEPEKPAPVVDAYTSRLLAAKRRARKGQDKKDEG